MDPSTKYRPCRSVKLANREWPDKAITKAPRWLSTDLRDGNQSLPDPMSVEEKKTYFHKLVDIGFKEIEVAFPSASQIDFDFTRYAVENAPADVSIQVLSPCREELIQRSVEAVKGAKKATIHLYLASSPLFRDVVFNMSEEEYLQLAVRSTKLVRELTKDNPNAQDTYWQYEFSPETFSDTPIDFAIRACEAVKKAWGPTVENPIIFNLPATVEMGTPNIYADQIEYFCKQITEREKVCVSLHCHNDRGCGVAATELGLMAGGDRVEGCLFGNGERTGNVDLVTLGLNLYTQGVNPNIDYSDIESLVELTEKLNKIPVNPRAPYGGSLVMCAFSGSHQDAIKKGFSHRNSKLENNSGSDAGIQWQIPYLPIDPTDIGRTYEAVIRVNSQSGKGGAAWIILRHLELDLPRGLQVAFSKIVQAEAEFKGRELKSDEIVQLFEQHYFLGEHVNYQYELDDYNVTAQGKETRIFKGTMIAGNKTFEIEGTGNGPVSSFLNAAENAFKTSMEVQSYKEHSLGKGSKVKAVCYLEIATKKEGKEVIEWGIGIHEDISQASMRAAVSVLNRLSAE